MPAVAKRSPANRFVEMRGSFPSCWVCFGFKTTGAGLPTMPFRSRIQQEIKLFCGFSGKLLAWIETSLICHRRNYAGFMRISWIFAGEWEEIANLQRGVGGLWLRFRQPLSVSFPIARNDQQITRKAAKRDMMGLATGYLLNASSSYPVASFLVAGCFSMTQLLNIPLLPLVPSNHFRVSRSGNTLLQRLLAFFKYYPPNLFEFFVWRIMQRLPGFCLTLTPIDSPDKLVLELHENKVYNPGGLGCRVLSTKSRQCSAS